MSAWIAVLFTGACVAAAYGLYLHYRMALAHRDALFAYGRMEDLLKRKLDLIPAVVAALKTYLSHERDTIDSVLRMRRLTVDARMKIKEHGPSAMAMAELSNYHQQLNQATWDLLGLLSEYPAIHMDQKLGGLLNELRELEPIVHASMAEYNSKSLSEQQEHGSSTAQLVAKFNAYAPMHSCEPPTVDLAMVKIGVAQTVPAAPSVHPTSVRGGPGKALANDLIATP